MAAAAAAGGAVGVTLLKRTPAAGGAVGVALLKRPPAAVLGALLKRPPAVVVVAGVAATLGAGTGADANE